MISGVINKKLNIPKLNGTNLITKLMYRRIEDFWNIRLSCGVRFILELLYCADIEIWKSGNTEKRGCTITVCKWLYVTGVIYKRSRRQTHTLKLVQESVKERGFFNKALFMRVALVSWRCSHLQTLMHNLTFNITPSLPSFRVIVRVCVCASALDGFAAPFESNNFHAYLKRCNKFLIEDSPAVHLACASHKATTTTNTRLC